MKLCEKFLTDATSSLPQLHVRFVANLRTQQEQEIFMIYAEVTGHDALVEISPVDIQISENSPSVFDGS